MLFKNLKAILLIFGMIMILSLSSCGGANDEAPGPRIDVAYVDSLSGDDISGDGSIGSPYKTITRAITDIDPASHIYVSPGIYNAELGEIFPLIIPTGVQIRGEVPVDAESDLSTKIRGAGTFSSDFVAGDNLVAVVLRKSAELRNLTIESEDGIAIWSEVTDANNKILYCAIRNSVVGIAAIGQSSLIVSNSSILNNSGAGIEAHDLAQPLLERNLIKNNSVGVLVLDSAMPGLSENATSDGFNEIAGNIFCDLYNLGTSDLNFIGTIWDDDPFSFSIENTCTEGANIVNEGTGGVSYQYVPPINAPVFSGTKRIPINSPEIGELLLTDSPAFSWTSTGAKEAILLVWRQPPNLEGSGVINENGFVWVWHSGLGTGFPGAVSYQDGRSSASGCLDDLTDPVALDRGRAYYWAVWEWDEAGMKISASSALSYFRVSN